MGIVSRRGSSSPKMEIRLIEDLDDAHVAFGGEKTDNTNKQLLNLLSFIRPILSDNRRI